METEIYKKNTDKVMDFICDVKEGKYTAEKPDLTQITYLRMKIQENTDSDFHDYFEDVILYGLSY
jgi:hypothetical protein